MSRAIHATFGNHAGPRAERGLEQYDTPPCATEALLIVESLPKNIWEPCSGNGGIMRVLEAHGHLVTASDLLIDGVNFLRQRRAPPDVEAIVTNPPFSGAAEFARHGLLLVPKVVLLQRIQWLESDSRADIFDSGKLASIHIFRNRVPRMHRLDWTGKRSSASMMLAWFVFEFDHKGKPTVDWIRCKR
jgi:hypothetical protein